MKTINVSFEDDEYNALTKVKKETSWRNYILNTIPKEEPQAEDLFEDIEVLE